MAQLKGPGIIAPVTGPLGGVQFGARRSRSGVVRTVNTRRGSPTTQSAAQIVHARKCRAAANLARQALHEPIADYASLLPGRQSTYHKLWTLFYATFSSALNILSVDLLQNPLLPVVGSDPMWNWKTGQSVIYGYYNKWVDGNPAYFATVRGVFMPRGPSDLDDDHRLLLPETYYSWNNKRCYVPDDTRYYAYVFVSVYTNPMFAGTWIRTGARWTLYTWP